MERLDLVLAPTDERPRSLRDLVPRAGEVPQWFRDDEAGVGTEAIFIGLEVPVGGLETDEALTAKVKSVPITPEAGALGAAGKWHIHTRTGD